MLGFSLLEVRMTNTRKNLRLVPIPKELLIVGKAYSVFSRKTQKNDIEGFFTGFINEIPRFSVGTRTWLTPDNEYLYYPISASRRLLERFGINVATLNTSFPARNEAFYAVPNFKRSLKQRSKTRRIRKN